MSRWGIPDTKSIEDLVAETEAGESELVETETGLLRISNGLGLDVFAEIDGVMYLLVESRQVFTNGTVRERHMRR